MKTTLIEVGKKVVFLQFGQHLSNKIDVSLARIFGIDQDVIQVNNYKNVEFFGQDLIDVILEAGWCIW